MSNRVLFARVGWMRWYKGQQVDDPKPVGGGKYTKTAFGHEAFNFMPLGTRLLGYFQPQMQPLERRKLHPSSIHLERIEPGFSGDTLDNVLVVFVARHPERGGQYIVGWYRNATVHRYEQRSSAKERNKFDYFVETNEGDGTRVPAGLRSFLVPGGRGGFGQANVRYLYDGAGKQRRNAVWISKALEYVASYQHEGAAQNPVSETDPDISELIGSTIERAAGYQSNPRIRTAIEDYAMRWALKRLRDDLKLNPRDKHKTEPYDFLCTAGGADLFVEVKGTLEDGRCIALTPNEVKHAKEHKNSALFIVHSVHVKGKRNPKVSEGKELFLSHWDTNDGRLEPRGYAFTLPESAFGSQAASGKPVAM